MKVTKLGYPQPILNSGMGLNAGGRVPPGGNDLQVLTSNGSNGRYWGENVARITANSSNTLLSPYVNFASGSNITFSISSNTLTIHGQGGGAGTLAVEDEGVEEGTGIDRLDFVGAGVAVAVAGTQATITITGASSKYSPDNTPATAAAVSDDFDDGSLTVWTWDSAPATADEATYPGFLYVDGDTTERHLNQAWTPGAVDITVAAKLLYAENPGGEASASVGIYVGDTTGNPANCVLWQVQSVPNLAAFNENGAGSFTNIFTATADLIDLVEGVVYLMIQRTVSGPTWRFYYSRSGLPGTWHRFTTTGSKSLTIGSVGIRADSDSPWAVDWIRAWSSLVDKVGS